MIDQMGVMLAGLKIEDTEHSRTLRQDSEKVENDRPRWVLKRAGHWLQVVGARMTSMGERIGHESDSALTTPLAARD
jgi:hypothetical protein